jgi:hypothetical protein
MAPGINTYTSAEVPYLGSATWHPYGIPSHVGRDTVGNARPETNTPNWICLLRIWIAKQIMITALRFQALEHFDGYYRPVIRAVIYP